jgi:hypothetical protein
MDSGVNVDRMVEYCCPLRRLPAQCNLRYGRDEVGKINFRDISAAWQPGVSYNIQEAE